MWLGQRSKSAIWHMQNRVPVGGGVIREAGTLERVLGEGLAAALDFRDGQKLR